MIKVSNTVFLDTQELEINAIRAQGAGGQNVNKVSSAVHLRFDIAKSSLPEFYKHRLGQLSDRRITRDGVIVIKAQSFRTQEQNRQDAIDRLVTLIRKAISQQKKRVATKPSRNARKKRTDTKTKRGLLKKLRQRIDD